MDLFEQLRREHEFGVGTVAGVAAKFGVHRRMVRQAIAGALPPPHVYPQRIKPKLDGVMAFIDSVLDEDRRAPLRGWAPRGARLPAKVPWGHWNTMTFIAALCHDHIDAPWLLDGPVNGERFQVYVERCWHPRSEPGMW